MLIEFRRYPPRFNPCQDGPVLYDVANLREGRWKIVGYYDGVLHFQEKIVWSNGQQTPAKFVVEEPAVAENKDFSRTLERSLGISLGVVMLLSVLLGVMVWLRRPRTPAPHDFSAELEVLDPANRDIPRELNVHSLTVVSEIGRGSFGVVYKALFADSKASNLPSFLVAVKELRAETSATAREQIYHE